jgi:hypothetical protein
MDLAEAIAFAAEGKVRAEIQKLKLEDQSGVHKPEGWDGPRTSCADDVIFFASRTAREARCSAARRRCAAEHPWIGEAAAFVKFAGICIV